MEKNQFQNQYMKDDEMNNDGYPLTIRDSESRFSLFPIIEEHRRIWKYYEEEALPSTWFASEVNMSDDINDWEYKLNNNQRHFLKYVLCFFAGSDKIVAENVSINFSSEINVMEAQMFYRHQAMMEDIHAHMYSILINSYIKDRKEQYMIQNAIVTMPVIRKKQDWARKFSDPKTASFAKRLVAFAVVEGVFFSASFAAIFYFKHQGLLPGLCKSNDFISKDEGLHCKFACHIYSYCKEKLRESEIHEIFSDAVNVEIEFITEAIPVDLINLSVNDMKQYIKFIADFWIKKLGYKPLYNVDNPLDFIKTIGMMKISNFFEITNDDYISALKHSESVFSLNEEF
jgi:ribonucleoside-diphosphate reductase beta chain